MCGITVNLDPTLHHRGPDDHRSKKLGKWTFGFNRLAINDTSDAGMQPFEQDGCMLVCNGEIYNHKELYNTTTKSNSDCECLIPLISKHGIYNVCNMIRGVFAFAWTDGNRILIARDPFGVRPLFYTKNPFTVASEIKALNDTAYIFPPGHFYDSYLNDFVCYYNTYWDIQLATKQFSLVPLLEQAVARRITNTDREVGYLLSGGLDSSLVCAIGQKLSQHPIRTFSIGEENSPDVIAAREVSKFLGTQHHNVPFVFEDAVKLIPSVIQSLESYDTTTVRASTPMWILCKWIRENTNIKVLLSGEGSDEIFGGYKYFKCAPNMEEFQLETIRRLRLLHQFDVLRADRCTAAHGLELRVPFLDRDFVECVVNIDPELKMTIQEKQVLRNSFEGYLPEHILHRRKDAFSDAVGYGWVDFVKQYASPHHMKTVIQKCNQHNVPTTPEEAWYRQLFWNLFGQKNDHVITEIWRPKWTYETDPSARKLKF